MATQADVKTERRYEEAVERVSAIVSRVVYQHAPIGAAAREILEAIDYQCYGDSNAVEDSAQAAEATERSQEPGAEEGPGADRAGVRRLDTGPESAAQAEGGDRPHPPTADLLPADNGGRSSVLASDMVAQVARAIRKRAEQPIDTAEAQHLAKVALEACHYAELVEENARLKSAEHRAVMANVRLGEWMSSALDDPQVCEEMQADIREWFSAGHPPHVLTERVADTEAALRKIAQTDEHGLPMFTPQAMVGTAKSLLAKIGSPNGE
jgi:hypothetical protein